MARTWRKTVLAAFAAAMLGACALDTSSSDNRFSHLFGRSSGDPAPAASCTNWFRRLFGLSSSEAAPAQPKVSAPSVEPAPAPKTAAVTSEPGTSTPNERPRPPPATGRYLVQLAAARTEAEAEALATKAKRTHPAELDARGQSIDQAVFGNMGTFYLVRFGPFASAQETRTVCAKVRDSGIDCVPVDR